METKRCFFVLEDMISHTQKPIIVRHDIQSQCILIIGQLKTILSVEATRCLYKIIM